MRKIPSIIKKSTAKNSQPSQQYRYSRCLKPLWLTGMAFYDCRLCCCFACLKLNCLLRCYANYMYRKKECLALLNEYFNTNSFITRPESATLVRQLSSMQHIQFVRECICSCSIFTLAFAISPHRANMPGHRAHVKNEKSGEQNSNVMELEKTTTKCKNVEKKGE